MLRISENSLEWALKHIEKYGDTDIFPIPFEYKAIRYQWGNVLKDYLLQQDILKWNVRPYRRLLTPKHKYGFRVATQLDPLDCILFTSLVYEIGKDIEKYRLPKEKKVAFSNRFLPTSHGDMYNWSAFQRKSSELLEEKEKDIFAEPYVVVADIADFFPRIYSHPLENALSACTNKSNHVLRIKKMLNDWNYSVSYGIPVGQSATRLLAELVLDDVDRALISEGFEHCRFVDDYRIFCSSKKEAYISLAFLANTLFENHGLTLQQHKTRILTAEEFREIHLISEAKKTLNNLSEKFLEILNELDIDAYDAIVYGDIPEDIKERIDELNMIDILQEQLGLDDIDIRLVSFILTRMGRLDNPGAIDLCLDNIDKLYPVFKVVFTYINELDCLTVEQKACYGEKIISIIDNSIVGHLEYHRAWVFDLFANDQSWNSKDKYVGLLNKFPDEYSRRKLILALGKSNNYSWFKSQKRNFDRFPEWERRALLAAMSCLPGDEAQHWYRSINNRLDILEKNIVEWAMKEF
ncbi:RNA-directed DNA polymerase [Aminipila butyrica]|uniref:RNA-directed DNA polymerase n=1 Tax=Aminipila butyrica TaxID=433296 RepID=A0A858BTN4_9FIRM|nr:RNA-directed DNA polymerase [Aminipila butyrica]QIB69293.1 RNA-directed DNA polymerase [Aminipila butyrica]